jgi:hypothetical protein
MFHNLVKSPENHFHTDNDMKLIKLYLLLAPETFVGKVSEMRSLDSHDDDEVSHR